MKRYHLVGIGGMGMSALAQVLLYEGVSVSGSDRSYDRGENLELFNKLKGLGIKIYPQDGSGVVEGINKVIISRAIEEDNPDLIMAGKLNIPVSYRQDELKRIFRRHSGIAIAGTSGKTTVVGMIGCIFDVAGQDITVINGGIMKNYITKRDIGNVHIGRLLYSCIETDESEGDLKGYKPEIGVITNIGYDHMSKRRLKKVYEEFAMEVRDKLIMGDSIMVKGVELYPSSSVFEVDGTRFKLNVPGLHNVKNALCAIGVAREWGISSKQIREGLRRFKGIRRRFDVLSEKDGIRVIDDYAHNPDKISATLQTAHIGGGRVIAVYQPHGYGPTRMFLKELAKAFALGLDKKDFLFIPDIYYVGGKVRRDISSRELVWEIKRSNKTLNVEYIPTKEEITDKIRGIVAKGDTILVMGARDPELSEWAKGII